jgi:hypothetical protein
MFFNGLWLRGRRYRVDPLLQPRLDALSTTKISFTDLKNLF